MNRFGVEELSPGEVKDRLDRKEPVLLLDVREYDEVAMASIEGAVHIPMGELGARLSELPQDKDVIVFCHLGSRSLMVAAQLKRRGYARVMHMGGGIDQWSRQVDASVPQYE
jgi:rhodanese-related sulfurtransferase